MAVNWKELATICCVIDAVSEMLVACVLSSGV